ncbi:exodeoxyribonuclease V subunit gamma [Burkholderia pseudomallei]|nr:exodeoxyribonuclease V subunit gamma [Burkholderia pseudomallei]
MNASVVILVAKQHSLYLMRSRKSQYFQCFVVDYVLILHPFGEGGTVEQRRESGNPPARAARSPASRSPAGGRRRGTTRDRASGHGKGGARRARDGRHAARAGDDVAGFGFASTLPGGGAEFGARGSGLGVRSSELGARSSEFGVRSSEFGARSSEFGVRSSELGARNSEPVRGARTRRIVGGVGWGGAGRGSGPERAAIGGGERGDAAVSGGARRYWMVFGDVGRPARRAAA